ncbi:MAG TPA: MFS transporter [Stellaceae bacterium]|nr:MFS transporter [Stellaceae bacterium]
MASSIAFGVIYSFGVFLKPMAADFRVNTASISAFFSITAVFYYMFGAPAGRIADRYGPRAVVAAGSLILGTGLCLTAFADDIRVAYLTYGIGVGIGGAACYVPTLAVIGGWFVRRRNTALGIAAAGTGAGTLAFPPLAAVLIEHYGWRTGFIAFGVSGAAILLLCALIVEPPPAARSPARSGPTLGTLLRSPPFLMLYFSWVLATMALFVPFLFLPAFAREHGAGEVAAAALVSMIGGTSIIGRLVLGPVGDRIGVVRLFKATVLAMGLSYAIWLLTGYWWLMLFAVVLGTSYGSRIAAVPVVLIELFGLENLGSTLGIFFTATGVAALLGPALAGLAVELSGGYRGAILFALAAGLLGFALVAPLRGKGG